MKDVGSVDPLSFPPLFSTTLLREFMDLLGDSREETYLRDQILTKYLGPDGASPAERRHAAIAKWHSVELLNAKTSERLWKSEASFSFGYSETLLKHASSVIEEIIGKAPPEGILYGSFSSGASTSKRKKPGVIARKYMEQADVTARAWKHLSPFLETCESWISHTNGGVVKPRFVRGNVMFTVPKTSVIDRVAAKEPDLNMFAQKGVGNFIRKRLRLTGIDLNNQAINRILARRGSKDGTLATLDLSSASDTVTTALVARLLPPAWFSLLDDLRCDITIIDGVEHKNSMFSSMGNGFTFELESLIFFSIARAVSYMTGVRGRISVYGDDLIVPSLLAPRLVKALLWCGFKVNTEKSFWTGSFRESCGGHYDSGSDVTPFYVKSPISSVIHLIHFLNRLRAWMIRTSIDCTTPKYYLFWYKYSQFVPKSVWGGFDLESKFQLVSPHQQHSKFVLVEKVDKKLTEQLQIGLYLASLRQLDTSGEILRINDSRLWPKSLELKLTGKLVYDELVMYNQGILEDFLRGISDHPVPVVNRALKQRYVLRRVRDFSFVFGLVKPLFLRETEL